MATRVIPGDTRVIPGYTKVIPGYTCYSLFTSSCRCQALLLGRDPGEGHREWEVSAVCREIYSMETVLIVRFSGH